MSLIKSEDNKKWINAFVAICAAVTGFVAIRFFEQMGEWFDLEAKIPSFPIVVQVVGIIIGLIIFVVVTRHKSASEHLHDVYAELVKVTWPKKEDVMATTVGLVIALSIISGIFVLVDMGFRKLLELIL